MAINLKTARASFYKYPLRNGQYLPIISIDVNSTHDHFDWKISGSFSDLFPGVKIPVWWYQQSKYGTPLMYLEVFQDSKIHIFTKITSTPQLDITLALIDASGNVYKSDNSISRVNDRNYLSLILYFLHFTDNKYRLIQSSPHGGFASSADNVTLLSNVTPNYNKGAISSSYINTPAMTPGSDNKDDTDEFLYLTKGLRPINDLNDPNDGGRDSKPGGGGGDGNIGGDTNPDDGLPTISALDSGLLTAYNPSVEMLQSLGRFLWSDSFNLDSFKKLFNDPFDTLLGLSVVPVKPNTSGIKSIMFGNMDSGVSAPVVSNQWVTKDMGSVTLNEVWKGALDYAPSTGVTIYLPFIGMRQLNVNDVMGSTLHLIYKFDVLTGACVAQIYVNHSSQGNKDDGFSWTKNQGLLYEFIGQCAENIPLASQDFTNTIRAAIGGVAVATGAAASIATGNPALGIAGLTVGAANLGMQASTPTVERGGHLSGSASILGYSQPFLIVERPHQCKPSRYYALRGVPSQVYTSKLSKCTNFTQITANNNLHIAGATDTELAELQNLLVAGVYFPDKKR